MSKSQSGRWVIAALVVVTSTVAQGADGVSPSGLGQTSGRISPTVNGRDRSKTVTVGQGSHKGKTNAAIQKAVDTMSKAGGGVVVVPRGTYMMHDALHLRSNVRVVGQKGAILKKVPSISSPITGFLGYGHYEFTVKDPSKFRVGMGVHLLDKNAGGFYTTVATITAKEGQLFYIDQMLNHDYLNRAGGKVISVFSLVEATDIHDAGIEDLVLDGNYPNETFRLNGCRGGGVFLLMSKRIDVKGVEVLNYHGDALSFQQCVDVVVEDCSLHNNTGHGLHPGSGSVRYVMRRVKSHNNGACGIYYCLRTTNSILEDCDLYENGQAGISIGERDTDHIVRNNRIHANAGGGIVFRGIHRRGGENVLIQSNKIGPNSAERGRYEIDIPSGLKYISIEGNTIKPAGGKILRVAEGCANISFTNNTVAGSPQKPGQVEGRASLKTPVDLPQLGPAALPANGARHLDIPALEPWSEDR